MNNIPSQIRGHIRDIALPRVEAGYKFGSLSSTAIEAKVQALRDDDSFKFDEV
jgi:hypothetical protein